MDVVYVCRDGENEELRYSLRSVAANLTHDRVWIFGARPGWVSGLVSFVETTQSLTPRRDNAENALRLACAHQEVSREFVLMCDDFYIMRPVSSVPCLDMGDLDAAIEDARRQMTRVTRYTASMMRARDILSGLGIDRPRSYELHSPMVFEKDALARILDTYGIAAGFHGTHYQTLYGNIHALESTASPDVKVYDDGPLPQGPFLSTQDTSFPWAKPVLRYLFPDMCRYEAAGPPTEVRNTMPQVDLVKMQKRQAKTYVPAEDVPVMVARGWSVVGARPAPEPAPTPVAGPELLYGYDGEHERYECLVCHKPYKTEAGVEAHVLAKHG